MCERILKVCGADCIGVRIYGLQRRRYVQRSSPRRPIGRSHESACAESLQGRRACPDAHTAGKMQCDAIVERESAIGPDVAGWQPPSFQARYKLPVTKGSGTIVAIVDAFDNPNVASDLAAYRTEFGLGTANFTKYNQKGQQKNYPVGNAGWGTEIDLDVEMVSASCPLCTIYLIEANDNYTNNLYAAEKEAVKLGATIVSNSYSGGGGSASGGAFDHKGVTYLASAGDSGYGMRRSGRLQYRRFGRWNRALHERFTAGLQRDGLAAIAAAAARSLRSLPGSTIRSAANAPQTTPLRSPRALPYTTLISRTAGVRSAARAFRRRWLPACTRLRATRRTKMAARTSGRSRKRRTTRTSTTSRAAR